MRKVVITFLLSAMLSMWAFNVVVPLLNTSGGGVVILNEDPHPHEEWD